jgi:ATP-dependent NAD(P)H-hydrate dehydratase
MLPILPISTENYKGNQGIICVIGGSLEYTGAPYFSGITALKLGADLVHIICTRSASIPIKSYSPGKLTSNVYSELIVHPHLPETEDERNHLEKIKSVIDRSHMLIIGLPQI